MKHIFLLFILTTLLLPGCGRKGKLIPPEALFPAAVADLAAQQKGARFLVSWTPPAKEVSGRALREPTGFALYRREVLPPAEDCEECPSAYTLVRENSPGYRQGARLVGGRLYVDDADVAAGKTYQYKVVSVLADGATSPPSNRARHRLMPPSAPPLLQGTSSTVSVVLTWAPVSPPADTTLVGYNVYRCREGEEFSPQPLNSTPVTEGRYEDQRVERGVGYRYAVRSVIKAAGESAESALSNEIRLALSDADPT
ncbi:MAG TPA: fibronectin type III domain-containing protein [Geobacteraceae bacterium]